MSRITLLEYFLLDAKERNMLLSTKTYDKMLKGSKERHGREISITKEEPIPMTVEQKQFELRRLKKIIDDNYSFIHVMRIKL